PDRGAGAGIVAPDRDLADRAARDALALAAGRGRIDDLRLGLEVLDPVELVHRIDRVHAAGLALAPRAVAGVHDHRLAVHPITDISAGAAAFHDLAPRTNVPSLHLSLWERSERIGRCVPGEGLSLSCAERPLTRRFAPTSPRRGEVK